MPKITFVQPDGSARMLDLPLGESVMRGAQAHDIAGILAECGGACACATCQVVVDPAWRDRLPAADIGEESMLDEDEGEGRRLSCQLIVTEAMDGMILNVPASQH